MGGYCIFIQDETGQGAAEYLLLFGAIIVIAIAALLIYRSYFQQTNLNASQDINNIRNGSNQTIAANNSTTNPPPTNKPSWP